MKIPVVNEQDEIIFYKDRSDRSANDIVRVTGLWITDEDGNILLAQRAFAKEKLPGLWGPAVAGTVEEGETYESNIIKEAEEEIGLKHIRPIESKKIRRSASHEYFVQWYTLVVPHDTQFKISEEEVAQVKWVTPQEILTWFAKHPEEFVTGIRIPIELFVYNENQK